MKVLSLFDGMACGMLAMIGAGLKVDRYVAFEIDKYAVQTSSHNFPMIEHRGDVFQADFTEFSGFDFLVGGSPCTYWSIAQKNNRETEASGMGWELFSQYVRALREAQPMYFIYENNKSMSNAIRESITETFGFEPVCINSALVSAQNRQRLYWVGRRNLNGTYSRVKVEQPEDRGILLKDVLDRCGAKELSEREMDYMVRQTSGVRNHFDFGYIQDATRDKGACVTANISKGVPYNVCCEPVALREKANCLCGNRGGTSLAHDLEKAKHNYVGEPVRVPEYGTDKARPLNAHYSNNCGGFEHRMFSENPNKQQVDMIASPVRIGLYPNNDGLAEDHQQNRVYSIDGKSVNLCGNGGGMGAKTGLYAMPLTTTVDGKSFVVAATEGFGTNPELTIKKHRRTMIAEPLCTTEDGKAVALKAQYWKNNASNFVVHQTAYGFKSSGVAELLPYSAVACEWDEDGKPIKAVSGTDGKTYTVYEVKDGQITIKGKQYPIKLADGFYIIRKLTVNECKRLQTVPEWYEFPVSDSQAYKMLGNGWTVEVIAHLIRATQEGELDEEQLDLFKMLGV